MSDLTAKQEAFALAYVETGKGAEAYRRAYEVGADTKPETVWSEASRLLANPRFEVVFPLSGLSAAVVAAQASASAAAASQSAAAGSESAAAASAGAASTSATNAANSATAAANSVAALPYNFSTTTADADPGAGVFRLNNAAPGSATAAYVDNLDSDGLTATGVLDTWDDSTSAVRGVLTIRSKTNAAIRHTYNVTGSVVDGSGYRKLTLAYVGGSGTLTNGAAHWLIFDRTGDNGSGDVTGPASSTADGFARFNGTTGKILKNGAAQITIAEGGTGQGTAALAFGALKQDASTTATGVVELATAAEVATGTDTARVPSVSTMGSHQGVAKAWVNFNGTGTVAIRDSYNVSSITDNGAGNYTLNFVTAMANANYTSGTAAGTTIPTAGIVIPATATTGSYQIRVFAVNNTALDTDFVHVAIFGD